jgi:hypothetical protein
VQYRPFQLDLPLRYEVDFVHTACSPKALLIPGCEMVGPRCVGCTLADGRELLRFQLLLLAVGQQAKDQMY